MDARSIEYVLGVEDCAGMVYDMLEEGKNQEELKRVLHKLMVVAGNVRSQRFMEDNGLLQ